MAERNRYVSRRHRGAWLLAAQLAVGTAPTLAQDWTLESSVHRAVEVAPELRAADAAVRMQEGALQQAGAWPNPDIELRLDNKIGKDAGTGGTDVTQLALSQPLPLGGRLRQARDMASADLRAAEADKDERALSLETEAARAFHDLQLADARLRLAEQRIELADALQQTAQRRQQAGELSRLERLRLDILREQAHQAIDREEGEYSEALARFRARLALPPEQAPSLVPLVPVEAVPELPELRTRMDRHPALRAVSSRIVAARSGIGLARAERLPDPVLRVFRERDYLDARPQSYSGAAVALTLPLWDRSRGRIGQARARLDETEALAAALERDLHTALDQSHLHLTHLIQQAAHFRERVREPAREVLELTRKGYAAGEAEILALVDANDTYFEAETRYLELLHEAWLEAAALRLAAGRSVLSARPLTQGTRP